MQVFLAALCLLAGAGLAVQAAANAQLSKAVGSPFAATTLQLIVAALILLAVTLASGTVGALGRAQQATWWHLLGGTASALFVISTIVLFPRIGAVMSVGLIIAGQVLASLAIDTLGLLGVHPTGGHPGIAYGAMLVMLGEMLIVSGQTGAVAGKLEGKWVVLALLAGAVLPLQGAVNALLRLDLGGAAFAVGTVSFVVAAIAMAAVFTASQAFDRKPIAGLGGLYTMPWWGWLGGLAGATYVITVFSSLPLMGASATIALTVAGQQAASLVVDQFGLLRLPHRPFSLTRLFGVSALLLGVAVIKLT